MKNLVIVRHGLYGKNDRLNNYGRAQMSALAAKLKPLINGASVRILTSPAARARESAEILGAAFSVEIEEQEVLWSEGAHPENFPEALKLVRINKDKADVLMLVTHYEYAEGFPAYFSEQELGIALHSRSPVQKGQALVLDCLAKTLTHVA